MQRYFPADYRVRARRRPTPPARPTRRPRRCGSLRRREERGALRLFLRALRRLDAELPWEATVVQRARAVVLDAAARRAARARHASSTATVEQTALAGADVVVLALRRRRARAGLAAARARRRRRAARRRARRSTRRLLGDGERGLLFAAGDGADARRPAAGGWSPTPTLRDAPARRPPRRCASTLDWARVADELEARLRPGRSRAATTPRRPASRAPARQRAADRRRPAHAHRPLPRLRDAGRGAAGHGARAGPRRDRRHRPQRGLRRPRRPRQGRRVRRQGDRRRGGQDRRPGRGHRPVPRGEDPARDDAAARPSPRSSARAGLSTSRTRSTACTRSPTTSTCWRSSTTSTRSRSTTRASRSARSTRRPSASPPSTGSSAGAGSDAHVAQGLGSVRDPDARLRRAGGVPRVAARRRDHHASRPALLYVQALKFLETKATPAGARAGAGASAGCRRATPQGADARRGTRRAAVEARGTHARHRRRDPREVPRARHPRAQRADARDAVLRPLPARQPDAGARLRAPAGRHLPAQVRAARRPRSRRASPSTAAPARR